VFGIGNLRVGAQLPIPGGSRLVLAVSVVLACAAAVLAIRTPAASAPGRYVKAST
jgi:hypothetical protein